MTISVSDIIALRQSIEADRKKLEEREKALTVVAEMLREQSVEQTALSLVSGTAGPVNDNMNFTDAVREAVKTFKGEEFHSGQVEAAVKASFKVPAMRSVPRIRISQILQNLAKNEVLRLTKRGKGSRPSMYRLKLPANGQGG